MNVLQRSPQNPILKPDPNSPWESYATFNGSIIKDENTYRLFYRAMSDEIVIKTKKVRLSTIGLAKSEDGKTFTDRKQFIVPEYDWEMYGCEDPRVTKIDDKYYIFYTAVASANPNYYSIKVAVAISNDAQTVEEKHLVTPFNAKGMTIFPEKINGKYTVVLTVDTDKPPARIAYAQFEHIETLWDPEFWADWYEKVDDYTIHLRRVSSDQIEVGAPPIKTKHGWVFIYSYIKDYFGASPIFRIEAAMLDLENPAKIIGRIEEPCLIPEESYEHEGQIKNVVFPEGALIEDNEVKVYYGAADSTVCLAYANLYDFLHSFEINAPQRLVCDRFPNNPLLTPIADHPWECKAVLNPATVYLKGTVYLMYRALSETDVSTFGLAISRDGRYIDERLKEPIYVPRTPWEMTSDRKGSYGCEDPRITQIDSMLYMCYTAYDGKIPRLAFTSISNDDFLHRKWDAWRYPKIISPPNSPDKDGCLFPEKINGKYYFFHRVDPNIIIDSVDDLDFVKKTYLGDDTTIVPRSKNWDNIKIGINAPPLKTEIGWLVFYHGISKIDHHYRLGVLLLDPHEVTKVIARSPYPILEPEMYYEKDGVVNNVVFPCGYVLIGNEVFIYYGGADKVVCGASINLTTLLEYLTKTTEKKYLFY